MQEHNSRRQLHQPSDGLPNDNPNPTSIRGLEKYPENMRFFFLKYPSSIYLFERQRETVATVAVRTGNELIRCPVSRLRISRNPDVRKQRQLLTQGTPAQGASTSTGMVAAKPNALLTPLWVASKPTTVAAKYEGVLGINLLC